MLEDLFDANRVQGIPGDQTWAPFTPVDDCPRVVPCQPRTCGDCLLEACFTPVSSEVDYHCERLRWLCVFFGLRPDVQWRGLLTIC